MYSKGAKQESIQLYSFGIVRLVETLEQPFAVSKAASDNQLKAISTAVVLVNLLIAILAGVVTIMVSLAVTRPLLCLLQMLRNKNKGRMDEGMTPLEGGSREVTQIYSSFASLFRIVRVCNTSFYSGDIYWACHIVYDSIKLFRKLNDEKAIGIACNNMGNILFSLSYVGKLPSSVQNSVTREDISFGVEDAGQFFDEAIRIGCKELEEAQTDFDRTKFAEQLADRCMNRALYCLERSNCSENLRTETQDDQPNTISAC